MGGRVKTCRRDQVYACGRVIEAFHEFAEPGQLSGDIERTSAMWEEVGQSERDYREIAEAEARMRAPEPNGSTWWEVFAVGPSAPAEAVRAAYFERLKQCHPDRVSGLACLPTK
jgi:hypothetical protein